MSLKGERFSIRSSLLFSLSKPSIIRHSSSFSIHQSRDGGIARFMNWLEGSSPAQGQGEVTQTQSLVRRGTGVAATCEDKSMEMLVTTIALSFMFAGREGEDE